MNTSLTLRLAVLVFAGLVGFFGSGCTAPKVQPWERATLTTYPMRADRDPQATALAEHTWFSREATTGGRGVGGSGCGCN